MPLRDWGIGLEELTEYYHRYGLAYTDEGINKETQLWIMSRGFVDQVVSVSKKNPLKNTGWKPREVDLVGVRINYNELKIDEIRLIQCKESVNLSHTHHIQSSLEYVPRLIPIILNARKEEKLTRYVSCVTITDSARKRLEEYGIKCLLFEEMTNKLLQHIDVLIKIKRRGFMNEPLLWMLRSLRDRKFLDKSESIAHKPTAVNTQNVQPSS